MSAGGAVVDLFLSPHNDDETLFGAFTIIREHPHVYVCLKSQVQEDRYGILAETREKETESALWWLGAPSWSQGLTLDGDPRYHDKLVGDFEALLDRYSPRRVWAPGYEEGGHEQHNAVAFAAFGVFGNIVLPYCTYARGSMRTRAVEVAYEPSWVWSKMRALCCYRSQIELENTRAWFMDDTLREYVPLAA